MNILKKLHCRKKRKKSKYSLKLCLHIILVFALIKSGQGSVNNNLISKRSLLFCGLVSYQFSMLAGFLIFLSKAWLLSSIISPFC